MSAGAGKEDVDDRLLAFLHASYYNKALCEWTRLECLHTWMLAHERMGRATDGRWGPRMRIFFD